jgi:ABC-type branched-subunit amino acid transport system ATPase component
MQIVTAEKLEVRTKRKSVPSPAGEKIILRIKGLQKAFGGQVVLDGVSLELRQGEVALLRGDNGSGKTTLLNILTGNLEPDAGTIQLFTNEVKENFHFPGRWWQGLNPLNRFTPELMSREGVGRTWQEIRLFPTQNLSDNIALATPGQLGENPVWALLRRRAVQQQERVILNSAEEALSELGLKGREISSADKVSLGQSKRVAIARAVQTGARILFLDEPLAGLDEAGVGEVMNLLERLACDKKITLVIVEHVFNISRILDLATTVWTLGSGKVTVETPASVRAEIEQTAVNGIQDWIGEIAGTDSNIVNQKLPGGAVLSAAIPVSANPSPVMLEVEDLVVHRGKRMVIGEQAQNARIHGLSFTLHKGQLAFLQAPNGWGKTTLLEAIAGLIPITSGSIRLNGKSVQDLPAWERAANGMSLLQARNHSFPELSVREALRLSHVSSVPENIAHLLERHISDLSGGEKQKVAMACVLGNGKKKINLLDEPFSALDPTAITTLLQSVNQVLKKSCIFLAVPGVVSSGRKITRY